VEITLLAFNKVNPRINKENSSQSFDTTKKNFIRLVRSTFATAKEQHHGALFSYFVVDEINTNNYTEKARDEFRNSNIAKNVDVDVESVRELDKRDAKVIAIDTTQWILEALERKGNDITSDEAKTLTKKETGDLKKFKNEQTPMMKIINHHIKVHAITTKVQQFNIGLTLSEETTSRKERLPFSRSVQTLRTVDMNPRFPAALEYSVIRALKDKKKDDEEWFYSKHGLRLGPIILSEMPWPELNEMTNQYLSSLSTDIMLYWLKVWIYSVLLKLVLA